MQLKLNRWTVLFGAEPRRKVEFVRPVKDSIAGFCFEWWLRLGPVCVFRLRLSRAELEKKYGKGEDKR